MINTVLSWIGGFIAGFFMGCFLALLSSLFYWKFYIQKYISKVFKRTPETNSKHMFENIAFLLPHILKKNGLADTHQRHMSTSQ